MIVIIIIIIIKNDHHHDHHYAQVILVKGHFYSALPLCSRDEPVFVAHCSPLAMPENREIVVQVL